MTDSTPVPHIEILDDAAARQYLHQTFNANVCIEAGAGTGKTTTIIDRVVTAFELGIARPEDLVLMTFTEAAAAELERRVRELLVRRLGSLPLGPGATRLRTALEHLPEARIGTIHSVAEGILQKYAREAGLPGSCSIISPLAMSRHVRTAFEDWMDMLQADAAGREFLVLADAFGITRSRALDLFGELYDAYDVVTPGMRVPSAGDAGSALAAGAMEIAAQARGALEVFGTPPQNHRAARLLAAIADEQLLHDLADPGSAAAYLSWWLALPVGGAELGNQKEWAAGGGDVAAFREGKQALSAVRDAAGACIAACGNALFAKLVGSLAHHVVECAQARKADGLATFHDLLVWTQELLRTRKDVREELRASSSMIIIDEFQDTDPIQMDIVLLLAGAEGSDSLSDLPPGRLTIVGDPKQSIYRFRDADLRMFTKVRDHILASGGTLCTLSANFRSHEGLLTAVNAHFAQAMGEDGGTVYRPLTATRSMNGPSQEAPRFIGDALQGTVDDRVVAEARAIAQTIHGLQAGDPDFRLGDCCIIVRSRTHLHHLQQHLEDSGIPSLVASGSLVLLTGDLRDTVRLLRAVAEPGNVPAVVGTLKSRVFACADSDLLAWHAEHGTWEYRNLLHGSSEGGRVGHALRVLEGLHLQCAALPVDAQIEVILDVCMLGSDAALHRNAADRKRRYAWLVRMARAYGRDRPAATLSGFADLLGEMVRKSSKDALPLVTGREDDAIRIMTVHEAKGLEFPTVILAGMQDPQKSRTPPFRVLVDRTAGRFAAALSSGLPGDGGKNRLWYMTAGFDDLDAYARAADAEEAVRLLYVAMTRPRDRLVVSMFRTSQPKEREDLSLTVAVREPDGPIEPPSEEFQPILAQEGSLDAESRPVEAEYLSGIRSIFAETDAQLRRALDHPTSQAITTVIHGGDGVLDLESGSMHSEGRGRGFGTFVHACIGAADLCSPASLPRVLSTMLARHKEFQQEEESILTMLTWASQQYGVATPASLWHEVPVAGVAMGMRLHGVIDMVVEQDGAYTVVDFKTDRPGPDRQRRQKEYFLQLALYAALLEKATGRAVLQGEIAYLADGKVVRLTREELRKVAAARSLAAVEQAAPVNGGSGGN